MQFSPYLVFSGQCETAFKFYEQCFGGKIIGMMTYAATPMDAPVPPAEPFRCRSRRPSGPGDLACLSIDSEYHG